MIRSKKYPLLVNPKKTDFGIYQDVTAEKAGWNDLNMQARLMKKSETWEANTGNYEYVIILLSGNFSVESDKGSWQTKNGRKDVFSGIAHSLYLPRNTQFKLTAQSDVLDIAYAYVFAQDDFPAKFKTPEEVNIEIRGGDNATRQINDLVEPGFGCSRIVAVEVYTPSGNWSSFPAHKHDERKLDEEGNVLEAELEETYFYKVDKPQGYAIQHVYTGDRSLDELTPARNNDVVLVPKGYHPVAAGHGYNIYYLNFLAGSDQSLANSDDPDHKWVYGSWKGKDPRIPMVTAEMNNATKLEHVG